MFTVGVSPGTLVPPRLTLSNPQFTQESSVLMTLEEARDKAQQRSRNGGTWMVVKAGNEYEAKPYAATGEKLAVFFGGREQQIS